jgi:mRNA interferase MazF
VLRGDVRWMEFGPGHVGESSGRRPAVIVSNNGANGAAARRGKGVVTVVPLTTNTDVVHRFQVLLPAEACGLPETSKAQVQQIRALAVNRVGPRMGTVPPHLMREIDEALRLHLALG